MKKNYLFGLLSLFTLLFAASCQEEELVDAQANTDVVSFSVTTELVGTRAATGEGALATKLYYGVYEYVNNAWSLVPDISKTDKKDAVTLPKDGTIVNLRLAKQKKYSVIFWAQSDADNELCNVNWGNRELEINANGASANQESYDAFWGYDEVTLTGALKREKLLVRPFAQLNIGVSDDDYQAAYDASVELNNSAVTVKKVPTTMSLVDGTVGTFTDASSVAYASAAIPSSDAWIFPVDGHKYLALNYVLVGTEQSLIDVELAYTDKENGSYSSVFTSVPVRRNYRTNIYGNLLTSDAGYSIDINAGWSGTEANIEIWDGKTSDAPVIDIVNNVAEVTKASQLAYIAQKVNGGGASNAPATRASAEETEDVDYSKLTIKLAANIDLGNEQWTPIGTSTNNFKGVLDGNGYTISNLKIVENEAKEGKAYIGFFGYAKDVTIKNVIFNNVNINVPCLDIDHSQGHIGAVAGSLEGTSTIEDVTVKGDIKVYSTQDANGASRVAVVAGGNSYGNVTMKNVHVIANDGSYLIANNNTGALAGQLQGKCSFENCSSNINITVNKFFAGGIIGLTAGDSKFVDCHTTGNVAVVAGREGRAHDQYRVGGIAGGWADNTKTPCVLINCSYKGTISGKNSDGSVANPLDYDGYVGRGYTLDKCQGSTVTVDDKTFVQAFSEVNLCGIYIVDGKYVADNLTELQAIINNVPQSDIYIAFASDIAGDVTIVQKEGVNLVIDGNQNKYNGKITVNGNGRSEGAETLTFKNIKFDASEATENFTFIDAPSKIGAKYNYSHNVTIEDCTFTGNYPTTEVGSASFTGTYNLVMKNCTATKMHSVLQVQSCDNTAYVENVKAIDCKNGISFGNTAHPTLKNSEINTREYGVRGDGDASRGNLVVENTVITAKTPLIVRKLKTNGYNVSLIGTNTLKSSDNGYQIVFTKDSDDKPYEEPTVNYTISGITKGLKMFPEREKLHAASGLYYNGNDANWKSVFFIYDAEDLVKAANYFIEQTKTNEANGVTFELLADIDMAGEAWTPWDVMWITFNGNNHKISNFKVSEGRKCGLFGYLAASKVNDLTLENITINGAQAGILAGSVEGVTTNNVTITGNNSVSYKPYSSETSGGIGAVTGVLYASTINATIAEGATVALNDNGIVTEAKFVNFLSGYLQENKGTIVNYGTVSVKASAPIVANQGSSYTGDVVDVEYDNAFSLQGAELTGNASITIPEGKTYDSVILEDVTADVNGDLLTVNDRNTVILCDCNITLKDGKKLVVFNNVPSADAQVLLHNVFVNGVKLTDSNAEQYLKGNGLIFCD